MRTTVYAAVRLFFREIRKSMVKEMVKNCKFTSTAAICRHKKIEYMSLLTAYKKKNDVCVKVTFL